MGSEIASDALGRGARGGAVTVIGQGIKLCVQLISVVVLARLLSPEDFGIVAMAAVFVALGNLLRDSGMPVAALQSRTLSNQQASNMFWINAGLGVVAAVLLVFATPLIVQFYSEDQLWSVVPVLAVTLALSGIQAQLQVHLARSMRFLPLMISDVSAQLCGLGVAVVMAVEGFGYWALVAQLVTTALVLLVARWIAAGWFPAMPRRGHDTRSLVIRGGHFGATQILTFVAGNSDTFLIGAYWGASPLGFYNRAFELLSAPIAGGLGPLTNVIVPTANALVAQGRSVETFLLRLQFAVGFALVWVFATSAATAPMLIPFAFGDGWEQSVILFQVLAIGGSFHAFSYVSYWAFIVHNQSKQLLYYNFVTKSIGVLLILCAVPFGVEYVAGAYSLSLAVSWPVNLIWLRRASGQPFWKFFGNGARLLLAGVLAFATASLVHLSVPGLPNIAGMIVTGIASTIAFFLAVVLVPGGRRELNLSLGSVLQVMRRQRHPDHP